MGTRSTAIVLLGVTTLALSACTHEEDPVPAGPAPSPSATSDAECAARIPDSVLATLGWQAATKAPEATVRGCHREATQGYVEVRDRAAGYDKLCATLDRTGSVAAGVPVDWLGGDVTACAVEPAGDLGTTKVVVQRDGGATTMITITAIETTAQDKVRAAVQELVG